ncbi:hypothetical protein A1Q2_03395 [Trichosporon asahii var. asahii CBS 8904]|uniref:Uncharacterized protein n=1 Tax=Trichosporon asahii var. asahii (strain CBS 8904) TaxID=1220162 RepID=K1WMI7_TRIAC|nr:hypothetical protein A1Q2_03395 [Trichosporon asahii var. asahii CBS 8904]
MRRCVCDSPGYSEGYGGDDEPVDSDEEKPLASPARGSSSTPLLPRPKKKRAPTTPSRARGNRQAPATTPGGNFNDLLLAAEMATRPGTPTRGQPATVSAARTTHYVPSTFESPSKKPRRAREAPATVEWSSRRMWNSDVSPRASSSRHEEGASALDLLAQASQDVATGGPSRLEGSSRGHTPLGPAIKLDQTPTPGRGFPSADDPFDTFASPTAGAAVPGLGKYVHLSSAMPARRVRSPYLKWTKEEDELLTRAVMEHGEKWDLVSKCVPTRSYHQSLAGSRGDDRGEKTATEPRIRVNNFLDVNTQQGDALTPPSPPNNTRKVSSKPNTPPPWPYPRTEVERSVSRSTRSARRRQGLPSPAIDTSKDLPDKRKSSSAKRRDGHETETGDQQEPEQQAGDEMSTQHDDHDTGGQPTGESMPGGMHSAPTGGGPPTEQVHDAPQQTTGLDFENMTEQQKSTAMLNLLLQQSKTLELQGKEIAAMKSRQDRLEQEKSSKATQRAKGSITAIDRELQDNVKTWRREVSHGAPSAGEPKGPQGKTVERRDTGDDPTQKPRSVRRHDARGDEANVQTPKPADATKTDREQPHLVQTQHPSPRYAAGMMKDGRGSTTSTFLERLAAQQTELDEQRQQFAREQQELRMMREDLQRQLDLLEKRQQEPARVHYQEQAVTPQPQQQQQLPSSSHMTKHGHMTPPDETFEYRRQSREDDDPFVARASRSDPRQQRVEQDPRKRLTYDGKFTYQAKDIPKFSGWGAGGKDLLSFIRAMDKRLTHCPDEEITLRPAVMFEGSALEWYDLLDDDVVNRITTWDEWKTLLKTSFLSCEHMYLVQTAAINKILKREDDVREYATTKQSLLRTAFPEMSEGNIGSLILTGTPAEWRAGIGYKPGVHSLPDLYLMMQQHAPQLSGMWWNEQLDRRDGDGRPTAEFYKKLEDLDSSSFTLAPKKKGKEKMSTPGSNQSTPSPPSRGQPPKNAEYWRRGQERVLGRPPTHPTPPKVPCPKCNRGYHYKEDCFQEDEQPQPQSNPKPSAPAQQNANNQPPKGDVEFNYVEDPCDLNYRPNNTFWINSQREARTREEHVQNSLALIVHKSSENKKQQETLNNMCNTTPKTFEHQPRANERRQATPVGRPSDAPTDAPVMGNRAQGTRDPDKTSTPANVSGSAPKGPARQVTTPPLTATVEEIEDDESPKIKTHQRLPTPPTQSQSESTPSEPKRRKSRSPPRKKPGSKKSNRPARSRSPSRQRAKENAAKLRMEPARVFERGDTVSTGWPLGQVRGRSHPTQRRCNGGQRPKSTPRDPGLGR